MTSIDVERIPTSWYTEKIDFTKMTGLDQLGSESTDLVTKASKDADKNAKLSSDLDKLKVTALSKGKIEDVDYSKYVLETGTDKEKKDKRDQGVIDFIQNNQLTAKLFATTLKKLALDSENTLFLFPVFTSENKGYDRLDGNSKYYKWTFKTKRSFHLKFNNRKSK